MVCYCYCTRNPFLLLLGAIYYVLLPRKIIRTTRKNEEYSLSAVYQSNRWREEVRGSQDTWLDLALRWAPSCRLDRLPPPPPSLSRPGTFRSNYLGWKEGSLSLSLSYWFSFFTMSSRPYINTYISFRLSTFLLLISTLAGECPVGRARSSGSNADWIIASLRNFISFFIDNSDWLF